MEQELRNIHFVPNMTDGTVAPSAPQFGGVQGDRNATVVSFFVPLSLRGSAFRYRIEGEDGAGGFVTTDLLAMDDEGNVATLLDERFTAAGGQILVRLAVSELQDGVESSAVRSFDGRVYFADAPTSDAAGAFADSLSQMMEENAVRFARVNDALEGASERLDAAESRLSTAENGLDGAESRLDTAESRLDTAEIGLNAAESRLDSAESRLDGAESRLTAVETAQEDLEAEIQAVVAATEPKETETVPWRLIQKIVRAGVAKTLFSVGDVLVSEHTEYGPIEWEIIGFDHETPTSNEYRHSMTLQTKHCLHRADGTYDLKAYDTADSAHADGVADWGASDLRAWLNSAEAGNHWGSYGVNDTKPAYWAQDGFMRGFGESFLNAVGTVKTTVSQDSSHSGLTTTYDKFFLPGRAEVYGGSFNNGTAEGTAYEGYGAGHSALTAPGMTADANRVKKVNGSASVWWLRSVNPMTVAKTMQVKADGSLYNVAPNTACAVAPVCCIY